MTLYGPTLAAAHNAGFTDAAEAAARMALELGPKRGRVVDLGCGGGPALAVLDRAGWTCWGCDPSPAMVEEARRTVPRATIVQAGTPCDFPAADAILAVGEILSFADAPLEPFFRQVRDRLAPDGFILFDVAAPGRAPERRTVERSGRRWSVRATIWEEDGVLTREIETMHRGEVSRERHVLRLLSPDVVVRSMKAAGLAAEALGGYDDHGLTDGWDAYLGRVA